jgi:hypothetical protein
MLPTCVCAKVLREVRAVGISIEWVDPYRHLPL